MVDNRGCRGAIIMPSSRGVLPCIILAVTLLACTPGPVPPLSCEAVANQWCAHLIDCGETSDEWSTQAQCEAWTFGGCYAMPERYGDATECADAIDDLGDACIDGVPRGCEWIRKAWVTE